MRQKFKLPRFYPVIDTAVLSASGITPVSLAAELIAAGAGILQYRHKDKWTQIEFDEAKAIANLCQQAGIHFVLNDRADFAQLLNAGLHIGQQDMPPVAARAVVSNAVLGFSTHNALQLRRAADIPADYLSLGPIFSTTSKLRPDPVVGLDGLRALRTLAAKPLVAIGGITLENAAAVFSAGADCIAVISAIVPPSGALNDVRPLVVEWLTLAG